MSRNSSIRLRRIALEIFAPAAILVMAALPAWGGPPQRAGIATDSLPAALAPGDTSAADRLIHAAALARLLADSTARRPAVLQVGFKVLFRSGHIPRSRYIGAASTPEGLAALKQALVGMPRQQPLVLYCGCCPWGDCPNVRPAYRAARAMGFTSVRVLYVEKNLQHDWVEQGLAIGQGER